MGWVIIIVIMFDCQSELLLKVLEECNVNWFAEVCDRVDMWSCVEDGVGVAGTCCLLRYSL